MNSPDSTRASNAPRQANRSLSIYHVQSLIPGKKAGEKHRISALYAAGHIRDVIKELHIDLADAATEIERIELIGPLVATLEDSKAWKTLPVPKANQTATRSGENEN